MAVEIGSAIQASSKGKTIKNRPRPGAKVTMSDVAAFAKARKKKYGKKPAARETGY